MDEYGNGMPESAGNCMGEFGNFSVGIAKDAKPIVCLGFFRARKNIVGFTVKLKIFDRCVSFSLIIII